ncbi:hypothetical protein [Nocardioides mesophilus]|uniref:WD40 repeat domain-containing protein n=1 Tax=Nocardioides mesophilus TaxID=433659 RepID=A0A7G9RES4_9ACTN|nr:hypothetical protein [Nocardioides mesophilus]QNN54099.1 hypothetical protein H9L09_06910 [Nocardioides mesophilus]
MFIDIEETLGRELREVADGLPVPPMPPVAQEPPRTRRQWQPLLVAASVVLVVAGVATVAQVRDHQEPAPAPAPTTPSSTDSVDPLPTSAPSVPSTDPVGRLSTSSPSVPYVLGQRLYVDGGLVPGSWWSVQAGESGWLALRTDGTWWWGRGPVPNELTGAHDVPPVLSPNGRYVAATGVENGRGSLTFVETDAGGEQPGGVPIDLGDRQDGSAVTIRAVTDDGRVIAQGTRTSLLWLPLAAAGDDTVDLSVTAPGQEILAGTSAGLVVTDGAGGEPYLAELSDAGEMTRTGGLPAHDDLVVSPGARWLAWTAPGTTGGEATSVPALQARSVDGSRTATLTPPAGWDFLVRTWVWEDDEHLVSGVVREGAGEERMARCSPQPARCVLVRSR